MGPLTVMPPAFAQTLMIEDQERAKAPRVDWGALKALIYSIPDFREGTYALATDTTGEKDLFTELRKLAATHESFSSERAITKTLAPQKVNTEEALVKIPNDSGLISKLQYF